MKKIMLHKDLDVWKLSMDLVKDIYSVTTGFPGTERYGLTQQIRRAAVSVPSNIAEGSARKYPREFIQFLYYALGSTAELETQLELAKRLGYLKDDTEPNAKLSRIGAMLVKLIRSIGRNLTASPVSIRKEPSN